MLCALAMHKMQIKGKRTFRDVQHTLGDGFPAACHAFAFLHTFVGGGELDSGSLNCSNETSFIDRARLRSTKY